MDKYEYRVCVEEINALIAERRFEEAKKIADTIDWRRVKNVNMLCKISDLYKINHCFEESRDILEMAHDRYPNGRSIVYGLCELELRLNDFGKAVTYYNDFVAMAPRDSGRYILQYKILSAQSASLEERIGVLEELKKHDYREKWAYTLAALYNQAGMTSKCAQECDEMIAAFGDGRYVIKALQLKKEKTPLTADQTTRLEELTKPIPAQQIEEAAQQAYSQDGQYAGEPAYDQSAQQGGYGQGVQQNGYVQDGQYAQEPVYDQAAQQDGYAQDDQYAQQPYYGQEHYGQEAYGQQAPYEENGQYAEAPAYGREQAYQEQPYPEQGQDAYGEAAPYVENAGYGAPAEQGQGDYGRQAGYSADNEQEPQEEIQVKTLDDSQFNTINLQQTVAAGVKELLKQEPPREDDAAKRAARSAAILKELQENEEKQEKRNEEQEEQAQVQEQPAQPESPETEAAREPQSRMQTPAENTEKTEEQPVTEELIGARAYAAEEEAQEAVLRGENYAQPVPAPEAAQAETPVQTTENTAEEAEQETERESAPAAEKLPEEQDDFAVLGREAVKPAEAGKSASWGELPGEALWQQTPEQVVSSAYDAVLAQETDGQYSMALEEEDAPEKQITGQLDIEGIMAEWEKIRRDNEEKRAKENRQRVLQNTGPIIAKFDETSKKGVLENMEREIEAEARSRRQMEARPSGSALSDGLTGEERNSAAVAAGRSVGRAVLEDEPVDEATKKWSPSAVLRTLRKEQALQNLPENYFPEKEEEKVQQESAAPAAEEKPAQEEKLPKDISPAQPQEDMHIREEASFEQVHDDAYEDDRQDEAYLQEEEEQAQDYYAEDAEDAQEAPQEYEDFRDNYDEEPEEDGEDYYGEQEEDAASEEEEEEPVQEDEDEESEDDMPVRRARNTPVEALHETQDSRNLPEANMVIPSRCPRIREKSAAAA